MTTFDASNVNNNPIRRKPEPTASFVNAEARADQYLKSKQQPPDFSQQKVYDTGRGIPDVFPFVGDNDTRSVEGADGRVDYNLVVKENPNENLHADVQRLLSPDRQNFNRDISSSPETGNQIFRNMLVDNPELADSWMRWNEIEPENASQWAKETVAVQANKLYGWGEDSPTALNDAEFNALRKDSLSVRSGIPKALREAIERQDDMANWSAPLMRYIADSRNVVGLPESQRNAFVNLHRKLMQTGGDIIGTIGLGIPKGAATIGQGVQATALRIIGSGEFYATEVGRTLGITNKTREQSLEDYADRFDQAAVIDRERRDDIELGAFRKDPQAFINENSWDLNTISGQLNWADAIGTGLGTTAPFLALGPMTGGFSGLIAGGGRTARALVSAIPTITVAGAAEAGIFFDHSYQRLLQEGLPPEVARDVSYKYSIGYGLAAGVLETFGLEVIRNALFKGVKASDKTIWNRLVNITTRGATGAVAEGATEYSQYVAEAIAEQISLYNQGIITNDTMWGEINRAFTSDEAARSAIIGGIVGGTVTSFGTGIAEGYDAFTANEKITGIDPGPQPYTDEDGNIVYPLSGNVYDESDTGPEGTGEGQGPQGPRPGPRPRPRPADPATPTGENFFNETEDLTDSDKINDFVQNPDPYVQNLIQDLIFGDVEASRSAFKKIFGSKLKGRRGTNQEQRNAFKDRVTSAWEALNGENSPEVDPKERDSNDAFREAAKVVHPDVYKAEGFTDAQVAYLNKQLNRLVNAKGAEDTKTILEIASETKEQVEKFRQENKARQTTTTEEVKPESATETTEEVVEETTVEPETVEEEVSVEPEPVEQPEAAVEPEEVVEPEVVEESEAVVADEEIVIDDLETVEEPETVVADEPETVVADEPSETEEDKRIKEIWEEAPEDITEIDEIAMLFADINTAVESGVIKEFEGESLKNKIEKIRGKGSDLARALLLNNFMGEDAKFRNIRPTTAMNDAVIRLSLNRGNKKVGTKSEKPKSKTKKETAEPTVPLLKLDEEGGIDPEDVTEAEMDIAMQYDTAEEAVDAINRERLAQEVAERTAVKPDKNIQKVTGDTFADVKQLFPNEGALADLKDAQVTVPYTGVLDRSDAMKPLYSNVPNHQDAPMDLAAYYSPGYVNEGNVNGYGIETALTAGPEGTQFSNARVVFVLSGKPENNKAIVYKYGTDKDGNTIAQAQVFSSKSPKSILARLSDSLQGKTTKPFTTQDLKDFVDDIVAYDDSSQPYKNDGDKFTITPLEPKDNETISQIELYWRLRDQIRKGVKVKRSIVKNIVGEENFKTLGQIKLVEQTYEKAFRDAVALEQQNLLVALDKYGSMAKFPTEVTNQFPSLLNTDRSNMNVVEALIRVAEYYQNLMAVLTNDVRRSGQQYSTSPVISTASQIMGINNSTEDAIVFEPQVGLGLLTTLWANQTKVVGMELEGDTSSRGVAGQHMGMPASGKLINVSDRKGDSVTSTDNAKNLKGQFENEDVLILANPPFGQLVQDGEKIKQISMDYTRPGKEGKTTLTTAEDAAMAFATNALAKSKSGTMVFVFGARGGIFSTAMAPEARLEKYNIRGRNPILQLFYKTFTVVSHTTVGGSLYKQMGTSFPVDVIVLKNEKPADGHIVVSNGRPQSEFGKSVEDVPTIIKTVDQLIEQALLASGEEASQLNDNYNEEINNEIVRRIYRSTNGGSVPVVRSGRGVREYQGSDLSGVPRESRSEVDDVTTEEPSEQRDPRDSSDVRKRRDDRDKGQEREPTSVQPGSVRGRKRKSVSDPRKLREQSSEGSEQIDTENQGATVRDEPSAVDESAVQPEQPGLEGDAKLRAMAEKLVNKANKNASNRRGFVDTSIMEDAFNLIKEAVKMGYKKFNQFIKWMVNSIPGAREAIQQSDLGNAIDESWDKARRLFPKWKIENRRRSSYDQMKALDRAEETRSKMGQDEGTIPFEPVSAKDPRVTDPQTVVPKNHASAITTALAKIEKETGTSIVKYVAKNIGLTEKQTAERMHGAQIDGTALVVYANANKNAFIIGDETGIGKGRTAVAAMLYARQKGLLPIFITKGTDLWGDILRDVYAVAPGANNVDTLEMLSVTPGKSADRATKRSTRTDLQGAIADGSLSPNWPVLSKNETVKEKLRLLEEAVDRFIETGVFVVEQIVNGKKVTMSPFALALTYSQIAPGNSESYATRQRIFEKLAQSGKVYLILDESHTIAGGEKVMETYKKAKRKNPKKLPPASVLMRQTYDTMPSENILFLSATFGKRADVLDLYRPAGMMEFDGEQLQKVLLKGGVPLMQALSQDLVERGLYIRREKGFDGIDFNTESIPVDPTANDQLTGVLQDLINFSDSGLRRNALASLVKQETGWSPRSDVDDIVIVNNERATAASFNTHAPEFVEQLSLLGNTVLLSLKAKYAGPEIVESIRNDQKPLIYTDKTGEAALKEFINENELSVGDVVDYTMVDVFKRFLNKLLTVTVSVTINGEKVSQRLRIEEDQLDLYGLKEQYNAIKETIESVEFLQETFGSPLDVLREDIANSGFTVGEATGRDFYLNKNNEGQWVLQKRTAEQKNKVGLVQQFNNGKVDVLLFNQTASTGVSAHASPSTGTDLRVRHMFIIEPGDKIDTLMQAMGRPNRYGQVVKPQFTYLQTNLPLETRMSSRVRKKMASLNANVTASSEGNTEIEVPELSSLVGDFVVYSWGKENPLLLEAMNLETDLEKPSFNRVATAGDLFDRVSSRLILLSQEDQARIYLEWTTEFNRLVEQLDRIGANPLVAKFADLEYRTTRKKEIVLTSGETDTGFTIREVEANVLTKPPTIGQVRTQVAEENGLSPNDMTQEIGEGLPQADKQFISDVNTLKKSWETRKKQLQDEAESSRDILRSREIKKQEAKASGESAPAATKEEQKAAMDLARVTSLLRNGDSTINTIDELASFTKERGLVNRYYARKMYQDTSGEIKGTEKQDEPVLIVSVGIKNTDPENPTSFRKSNIEIMLQTKQGPVTFGLQNLIGELTKEGTDKPSEPNQFSLNTGISEFLKEEMTQKPGTEALERKARYIATGNLVSAVSTLGERDIAFATTEEGELERVILLPDDVNLERLGKDTAFNDFGLVKKYFASKAEGSMPAQRAIKDNSVGEFVSVGNNQYQFLINSRTRKDTNSYLSIPEVKDALENATVVGKGYRLVVNNKQFEKLFNAMRANGFRFTGNDSAAASDVFASEFEYVSEAEIDASKLKEAQRKANAARRARASRRRGFVSGDWFSLFSKSTSIVPRVNKRQLLNFGAWFLDSKMLAEASGNANALRAVGIMEDAEDLRVGRTEEHLAFDRSIDKKIPKSFKPLLFDLMDNDFNPVEIMYPEQIDMEAMSEEENYDTLKTIVDALKELKEYQREYLIHFKIRTENMRNEIVEAKQQDLRNALKSLSKKDMVESAKSYGFDLGVKVEPFPGMAGATIQVETRKGSGSYRPVTKEEFLDLAVENIVPTQDYGLQWAHMAHIWTGNYILEIVDTEGNKQGNFQTSVRTEAAAIKEANRLQKQVDEMNAEVGEERYSVNIINQWADKDKTVRVSDAQFFRIIKEMNAVNPGVAKDALRGVVGRKRFKQPFFGSMQRRKGVQGFERDFFKVWTYTTRSFERWKALREMNAKLGPIINDGFKGDPGMLQFVENIQSYINGEQQNDKLIGAVEQLFNKLPIIGRQLQLRLEEGYAARITNSMMRLHAVNQLTKVSFQIINATQPYLTLYPEIARYLSTGEAELFFAKNQFADLSPRGRKLLKQYGFVDSTGKFLPGSESDLPGIFGDSSDLVKGTLGRLQSVAGVAERRNLNLTFIMGMFLGLDKLNMSEEDAARFARTLQNQTQYKPNKARLPGITKDAVGKLFFQFKRWMFSFIQSIANDMQRGDYGVAARKIIVFTALGGFAAFGAAGDYMRDLFNLLFGDEEEDKERLNRMLEGENLENLTTVEKTVFYGLPTFLSDFPLSSQMQLFYVPEGETLGQILGEYALGRNAIQSLSEQISVLIDPTTDQRPERGRLEALASNNAIFRSIKAAMDLANDEFSQVSSTGKLKDEATRKKLAAKILGFNQSWLDMDNNYQLRMLRQRQDNFNTFRKRIIAEGYQAFVNQDEQAKDEVNAKIAAWNKIDTNIPLTPSNLKAGFETYRKGRSKNYFGRTLDRLSKNEIAALKNDTRFFMSVLYNFAENEKAKNEAK